ncbi:hypothetical protein D3C78_1866170 [compost metagenome]
MQLSIRNWVDLRLKTDYRLAQKANLLCPTATGLTTEFCLWDFAYLPHDTTPNRRPFYPVLFQRYARYRQSDH